ncbi:hypothetical protein NHX12_010744 [Muraenolepis orangiensis]|uniref:Uncharacterized protein n=1 Tax=Muraenolepis orangiensis TaxID=630683 RepID=A0A9Q0I9M9_9TELE|nr:hypothetical protein NHX12_010744 [Muraenolepis orangiensis]
MLDAVKVWELQEEERSRTARIEAEKHRKRNLYVQALADYWEASLGGPTKEALVEAPPEEQKTPPHAQLPSSQRSSPTTPPCGTTVADPEQPPLRAYPSLSELGTGAVGGEGPAARRSREEADWDYKKRRGPRPSFLH